MNKNKEMTTEMQWIPILPMINYMIWSVHTSLKWIMISIKNGNHFGDESKRYKIESFEPKYCTCNDNDIPVSLSNMRADDIDYNQKMSSALMNILFIECTKSNYILFEWEYVHIARKFWKYYCNINAIELFCHSGIV